MSTATAPQAAVTTPVVEAAPDLLGEAAEAAIADLEREFAASNLDAEEAALAPAPEGSSPQGDGAPADAKAPAEVKAAAPEEPAVARGLERLVAREVEVRTQEAAVAAARAQVDAARAEMESLRASHTDLSSLRAQAAVDPEAALAALGLDPSATVQLMIARKLGDKAPPELRAAIREQALARRMADLEAREAAAANAAAAQQFFSGVERDAHEYVTKGVSEHAPVLSRMSKAAPAVAHAWIMEEIRSDAAARAAREPNGRLITYDEAARRAEARLAPIAAALGGAAPSATPAPVVQVPAGTTAPKTVAQPQAPAPPAGTPRPTVDKPMFPWQRRDATEDDGLRAALAEYRRLESAPAPTR